MRLFVAINFSDATRKRLCRAAEALRTQGQGQFSPAENLHLTLAFLGETESVDAAVTALERLDFSAFSLQFAELGQFGTLHWAGIRENTALRALQAQLIGHLKAAGFPLEDRDFIPHITLVRHFSPNPDFSPIPAEQILSEIEEPVREIALMASQLCAKGSQYEVLAVKQLSAK